MTVTCDFDGRDGEARSTGPPNVARDCRTKPRHIVCDAHVRFDEDGFATCPVCHPESQKA